MGSREGAGEGEVEEQGEEEEEEERKEGEIMRYLTCSAHNVPGPPNSRAPLMFLINS